MSLPKIYVAGHTGMVGSAIVRLLKKKKVKLITKSRQDLDLIDQKQVLNFLKTNKPDQVYLAAAKVGGINSNQSFPADFIYQNAMIQANIINSSFLSGVKKLLFLGSSCIYPRLCSQPIKEESLLSGYLEPTNEPYAIAKILGIKLCESYNRQYSDTHNIDYRSIMPTNLYGPGDSYDIVNCHVIPALIKKFHQAVSRNDKEVVVWGTGLARREFLHVDDLALAAYKIMNISKKKYDKLTKPMCSHINVGFGYDLKISSLAKLIKEVTNFRGIIKFDKSKPDGIPRKLLSCNKIRQLGWKPAVNLKQGLISIYKDYKKNHHE